MLLRDWFFQILPMMPLDSVQWFLTLAIIVWLYRNAVLKYLFLNHGQYSYIRLVFYVEYDYHDAVSAVRASAGAYRCGWLLFCLQLNRLHDMIKIMSYFVSSGNGLCALSFPQLLTNIFFLLLMKEWTMPV